MMDLDEDAQSSYDGSENEDAESSATGSDDSDDDFEAPRTKKPFKLDKGKGRMVYDSSPDMAAGAKGKNSALIELVEKRRKQNSSEEDSSSLKPSRSSIAAPIKSGPSSTPAMKRPGVALAAPASDWKKRNVYENIGFSLDAMDMSSLQKYLQVDADPADDYWSLMPQPKPVLGTEGTRYIWLYSTEYGQLKPNTRFDMDPRTFKPCKVLLQSKVRLAVERPRINKEKNLMYTAETLNIPQKETVWYDYVGPKRRTDSFTVADFDGAMRLDPYYKTNVVPYTQKQRDRNNFVYAGLGESQINGRVNLQPYIKKTIHQTITFCDVNDTERSVEIRSCSSLKLSESVNDYIHFEAHLFVNEVKIVAYLNLDKFNERFNTHESSHCLSLMGECKKLDGKPEKQRELDDYPLSYGHVHRDMLTKFDELLSADQRRTVSWIIELEQDQEACKLVTKFPDTHVDPFDDIVRLFPDGPYFSPRSKELFEFNPQKLQQELKETSYACNGVILLESNPVRRDDIQCVSTSTKQTALALVEQYPFPSLEQVHWTNEHDKFHFEVSSATLIFCSLTEIPGWTSLIRKHCPELSMTSISTSHALHQLSWGDVLNADIVIMPLELAHGAKESRHTWALRQKDLNRSTSHLKQLDDEAIITSKPVVLERVMWWRMIIALPSSTSYNFKHFKASFYVMLATAEFSCAAMTEFLQCDARLGAHIADETCKTKFGDDHLAFDFVQKFVRRTGPKNTSLLNKNGLQETLRFVAFSSLEAAVARINLDDDKESETMKALMRCNYFGNLPQKKLLSIANSAFYLGEAAAKEIKRLELLCEQDLAESEEDKRPEAEVEACKKQCAKLKQDVAFLKLSLLFIDANGNHCCSECSAVFDRKEIGSKFNVVNFEKVYCGPCSDKLVQKASKVRRQSDSDETLDLVPLVVTRENKFVRSSKYPGAKLSNLHTYFEERIQAKFANKYIVYVQDINLLNLVYQHFAGGLNNVYRAAGNRYYREVAIKAFKEQFQNETSILFVLADDLSTCGQNFQDVPIVILLHPFWSEKGDKYAMAKEMECIARCWPQSRSRVEVIRFISQGTVEEEICKRRGYANRAIKSVADFDQQLSKPRKEKKALS